VQQKGDENELEREIGREGEWRAVDRWIEEESEAERGRGKIRQTNRERERERERGRER
jgi:hypothetical protein